MCPTMARESIETFVVGKKTHTFIMHRNVPNHGEREIFITVYSRPFEDNFIKRGILTRMLNV